MLTNQRVGNVGETSGYADQPECGECMGDTVLRLQIREWGMWGRHQVMLTNQRVGNVRHSTGCWLRHSLLC